MRSSLLKLALAATTVLTIPLATAPASADPHHRHGWRDRHERVYDSRGRYVRPHRVTRDSYVWRGRDGRYYCRRDNGTTGLLIGAGVGALAGHELSGRGDHTLGTILGGVLGGVLGREIDRGDLKCR